MKTLSWKLTSNTIEQNTLLKNSNEVYDIDLFVCSCEDFDFVVKDQNDSVHYICKECENEIYYDANEANENIGQFVDRLKDITQFLTFEIEKESDIISSVCYLNLPYKFSFLEESFEYKKVYIYKLHVNKKGDISKTQYGFIPSPEISTIMTNKLYPYILLQRQINQIDLLSKKTFNMINNEFIENIDLIDYELLDWELTNIKVNYLDEAFQYILNQRKEKSVKRAIYEAYEKMIRSDGKFNPIYTYALTKHIKDPNILSKVINLPFYQKILDTYSENDKELLDNGFESFIVFLKKYYSETQIYNMLKSEKSRLLKDIIQEIVFYEGYQGNSFQKTKANLKLLHNALVKANKTQRDIIALEMSFSYVKNVQDRCIDIDGYLVLLPTTGKELSQYANDLENCMLGYADSIYNNETVIYLFFREGEIKFAVEILDNQLWQASSRDNNLLNKSEKEVLKKWLNRFQLVDNLSLLEIK